MADDGLQFRTEPDPADQPLRRRSALDSHLPTNLVRRDGNQFAFVIDVVTGKRDELFAPDNKGPAGRRSGAGLAVPVLTVLVVLVGWCRFRARRPGKGNLGGHRRIVAEGGEPLA